MAKKQKIYKWCGTCSGKGKIQGEGEEVTCPQCNGKKKVDWGYLKVDQEEE